MNNYTDEIYSSITKKQIFILFGAGGAIGLLIFLLCYGFTPLDVTNDGWLLQGGDLMQHYVGWKAYRTSEWQFPIGMTEGLLYPAQTCVVFTDSIPLFAIFFKLLSPILPETFQYFGLWGALTFILMGGIAAVVLRKFTQNLIFCIVGSIFFSFSPYVIQRMYAHTALAGNWIILLAIAIWVYKPYFNSFKRKTIAWTCLLVSGSLVHIYYIPMIMIFMIFSCFQDLLENKGWKKDILMGGIAVLADLAVLYSVGAFSATSAMDDGGLGAYSSNLNVFFNPLGKGSLLPSRPYNPGQDEGYGYLGLGILILLVIVCLLAAAELIKRLIKQEVSFKRNKHFCELLKAHSFSISMVCAWLCTFILAISPIITYNNKTLLQIPYPDKIIKLLSIFRASGRFIWCSCYILMFFAIIMVIRKIHRMEAAIIVLFIAGCIQVVDLKDYALERGQITQASDRENVIASTEWEELAAGKRHLTYLPFSIIKTMYDDNAVYEFANFAIDHGLTVNYYTAARVDINALGIQDSMLRQSLAEGEKSTDTLYILDDPATGEEYDMITKTVDGIAIGYFE